MRNGPHVPLERVEAVQWVGVPTLLLGIRSSPTSRLQAMVGLVLLALLAQRGRGDPADFLVSLFRNADD